MVFGWLGSPGFPGEAALIGSVEVGSVWKPHSGEAGLVPKGFRQVVWHPSDTGEAT